MFDLYFTTKTWCLIPKRPEIWRFPSKVPSDHHPTNTPNVLHPFGDFISHPHGVVSKVYLHTQSPYIRGKSTGDKTPPRIPRSPLGELNPIKSMYSYVYLCVYSVYMSRDPHTPPLPQPDGSPPPCGRGGGVFSAAKPIYAKYIAQCKECASNVQGTAWAALVSIHRNHGVCSLYSAYSAYSAYVSIIRMDILYVI